MNHLSAEEYDELTAELANRYEALRHYLKGYQPKDQYDGAGGRGTYWNNPEDIRLLNSSRLQRQRAIADMKVVLAQISAIK